MALASAGSRGGRGRWIASNWARAGAFDPISGGPCAISADLGPYRTANGSGAIGSGPRTTADRARVNFHRLGSSRRAARAADRGQRPTANGQRPRCQDNGHGIAARRFGNWYAGHGPPYLTIKHGTLKSPHVAGLW